MAYHSDSLFQKDTLVGTLSELESLVDQDTQGKDNGFEISILNMLLQVFRHSLSCAASTPKTQKSTRTTSHHPSNPSSSAYMADPKCWSKLKSYL